MPALLYSIGVVALFAGLVMIGFGIPINEFSFGNTLISAGTTAGIGGLIIVGLGVVAGQLRRVTEALAAQSPGRLSQPIEAFENIGASRPIPAQGRIPFPSRPKSEAHTADLGPAAAAMPFEDKFAESFAPTLRNPDESPVTVEDEISLSPRHPVAPAAQVGSDLAGFARPSAAAPGNSGSSMGDKGREPMAGWRSPPPPVPSASPQARPLHSANFDAMWPLEAKLPKGPAVSHPQPEAKPDTSPRDALAASNRSEPEAQKPRAAAILKSGVVDGMGYTLYVDGSIEAELPQGTIRFASINELRSHLAKNP
jgi:hypothetical protein